MGNQLLLIALDSVAVSFGMFIIHMYIKVFLTRKDVYVVKFAMYPLFGAALVMLSFFYPNIAVIVSTTFLGVLILSSLLFDGSWHKRFFVALSFCVMAAITEYITMLVMYEIASATFVELYEYGELRIIGNILSNLLCLFAIKVIAVFLKGRNNREIKATKRLWELTPLLVFLVFSIVLVLNSYIDILAQRYTPSVLVINIVALVYMNIIVFWYYDRIMHSRELKYEREVMGIQAAGQLKYYEMYHKQHDELVAVLHDIDKHRKVMEALAHNDLEGEVSIYFNKYKKLLSQVEIGVHTPNPVISIILSECIKRAREIGIKPIIEVQLNKNIDIDPIDITTILGNTIDNAMFALSEFPEQAERHLSILLRKHESFLIYEIKNSFIPKKRPATRIGYGLRNVRACVRKYDGNVSCEAGDGGIYSVCVTLQL